MSRSKLNEARKRLKAAKGQPVEALTLWPEMDRLVEMDEAEWLGEGRGFFNAFSYRERTKQEAV